MGKENAVSWDEYRFCEIKTAQELKNIEEAWHKLYAGKNAYSHFQSFEWAHLYTSHCLNDAGKLAIYLLYRENELIAIAPLLCEKKFFVEQYKFIHENTQADYADFIYDDLSSGEMELFLKKILARHRYSILRLRKIHECSRTTELLANIKSPRIIEISQDKCVQIKLHDDFRNYADRFGKSTKREIKSIENKIKKNFANIEVKVMYDQLISSDFLDKLMDIYLKRRMVKFGQEKRTAEYFDFLKSYILQNRDTFISFLELDKELVAFNIGFFSKNDKLEILITSFETGYRSYEVGNYLLYNTIQKIIESKILDAKKVKYYDLGWGDERYKMKYGGEVHHIREYFLCDNYFYYGLKKCELYLKEVARKCVKRLA